MNKIKLLAGATLLSALLSTTALAATDGAQVNPAPQPDTVVSPTNLPRQYLGSTVKVSFTVDENGQPHDIALVRRSHPALERSLITALAQWRFTPAQENGVAVAKRVILPLKLVAQS
jgi:TonB family protein